MNSRLLLGHVWHCRPGEQANSFKYRVLYVELDLTELDLIGSVVRLLGHNAKRPYSVNDRDHTGSERAGFVSHIQHVVQSHLPDEAGPQITLITQPSLLGYVFNPVSFYVVRGWDGEVKLVVAEVHNREGGRHTYVLELEKTLDGRLTAEFDKEFYVSPFQPMHAQYRFFLNEYRGRLSLGFDVVRDDNLLLSTGMELAAKPLNDINLAKAFFTHPFVPQKSLAMIYWQALKLHFKGAKYRRPPANERKMDAHVEA
ncbi:MAG: DUF1365 domain-containing protein [Chloroflexi bacterium]|nr:DUF1365 domain-containing protein [Chloroflexota bacterium]MDA1174298.1 DUF1365 domain-containing protein [Chloroflexota bacterium]